MGGFYIYRTSNDFGSRDTTAELGWNLGGGIQYDIGLGPWLDIAVEYHTINNIPGPVDPNDEEKRVDIDANDISLKIGVVFFLGD